MTLRAMVEATTWGPAELIRARARRAKSKVSLRAREEIAAIDVQAKADLEALASGVAPDHDALVVPAPSLLDEILSNPIEAREFYAACLGLECANMIHQAMVLSEMDVAGVAKALGVSQSDVRKKINGEGDLSVHTLARYLGSMGFELTISLRPSGGF